MKFDSAKALETFRELDDPRFSGPDGEARVADFVADRFSRAGLDVERREVVGSAFPQRVAPWVESLGYAVLSTGAYLLLLPNSVLSSILACLSWFLSVHWCNAVLSHRIRPGRRRAPLQSAPVVIASMRMEPSPPLRVVFQALVGGLEPDLSRLLRWTRPGIRRSLALVSSLLFLGTLACKVMLVLHSRDATRALIYDVLTRYAYPGFLAIVWAGILGRLYSHCRASKGMKASAQPERHGLALLLEMARTWPRSGSRTIEPVFVAAGGQRLDHAGSREVVRLLGSEWGSRPSLLILLLAPGAGEKIGLWTNDLVTSGTDELARDAGRSLWIPIASVHPVALLPLWPFASCYPVIALIGPEPRDSLGPSVDPQALHRAAQLATEIALRWAKQQLQIR